MICGNRVAFHAEISEYFPLVRHRLRTAAMAEKPAFKSGRRNEARKGGDEVIGKDEASLRDRA